MGYADQNLPGDEEGDIRPNLRAQEEDPETDTGADKSDSSNPKSQSTASASDDDNHLSPFERSQKQEADEDTAMAAGLSSALSSGAKDKPEGKGLRNFSARTKNKNRKRLAMGLAGSGILGLFVAFSIFGFGALKLDQLLNTIDTKTFSRLNASVSGRSDKWLKSYIQIRLLEQDGKLDPSKGNLYFRSNKVDTNRPLYDWYRTLRTSSFEKDVFEKNGIKFTSMVGPDGKFRTARIDFGGSDSAKFDPEKDGKFTQHELQVLASGGLGSNKNATDFTTLINRMGANSDHFVSVQVFDSDKAARRDVKRVVKENTKSYQVFKRVALRRDIQNMTGIRSWRFFEKTQGKIEDKKLAIQNKILQKVFNGDSNNQKFILCLFGAGSCPSSTDPNDPANHTAGAPHGGSTDSPQDDTFVDNSKTDKTGKKISTPGAVNGSEVASGVGGAVDDVVGATDGSGDVTKDVEKKLISKLVGGAVGTPATKAWPWLKKIKSIDDLFISTDGGSSKLAKLVQNARLAQVVSLYATVGIARDQLHTGEVNSQEVGAMMEAMGGYTNSEGWDMVTNKATSSSTVSAATTTDISKNDYCNPKHKQLDTEYAYFCDSDKPNSGGKASTISEAYKNSVGIILHPIAGIVGAVKNLFGPFLDFFSGIIDSLTAPAVQFFLDKSGLGNVLADVIGTAMSKLLGFIGAGPMYTPHKAGNLILAGSAGTAEASTRASSGIKSTKVTLEYSNRIAAGYEADQASHVSMYDRYASLSNPNSLLARGAIGFSNLSVAKIPQQFLASLGHLPTMLGDIFNPAVRAATSVPGSSYAQSAGVDTYDIPQACMDLDPLDSDYLAKATNLKLFPETKDIPITSDLLGNSDKFWAAVYDKIGDKADGGQSIADQIYNCMSLDGRIRTALGGTHGYSDDNSYTGTPVAQQAAATTPASTTIDVSTVFQDSTNTACAPPTRDLGIQDGYYNGNVVKIRICALPNMKSFSEESHDGYGITGANGQAIVNSRISAAMYAMIEVAKKDGVTLQANSSFRTMAHQQSLCPCNGVTVAFPGNSNHQMGLAIDYGTDAGAFIRVGDVWYRWLETNAGPFGIKNYPRENWHWSPTGT